MDHFIVAGVKFRMDSFTAAQVKLGDQVELKPEPLNPYDPNAIAVYKGEHHIGYVPKNINIEILGKLALGSVTCLVESAWPKGCGISVDTDHEDSKQSPPPQHD